MWLPLRRASEKPFRERMAQTSRPERTRSLPNLYLKASYKYLRVTTPLDLVFIRGFQKQFDGFLKILASLLNRCALTGNVKLGTKPDISIALALDNCCELLH
jgi:hypothetical protein